MRDQGVRAQWAISLEIHRDLKCQKLQPMKIIWQIIKPRMKLSRRPMKKLLLIRLPRRRGDIDRRRRLSNTSQRNLWTHWRRRRNFQERRVSRIGGSDSLPKMTPKKTSFRKYMHQIWYWWRVLKDEENRQRIWRGHLTRTGCSS